MSARTQTTGINHYLPRCWKWDDLIIPVGHTEPFNKTPWTSDAPPNAQAKLPGPLSRAVKSGKPTSRPRSASAVGPAAFSPSVSRVAHRFNGWIDLHHDSVSPSNHGLEEASSLLCTQSDKFVSGRSAIRCCF